MNQKILDLCVDIKALSYILASLEKNSDEYSHQKIINFLGNSSTYDKEEVKKIFIKKIEESNEDFLVVDEFVKKSLIKMIQSGEMKPNNNSKIIQQRICEMCKQTTTIIALSGGGLYKFKKCGKCKIVFYCSKFCQCQDWEKHKLICKKSK